MLPAHHFHGLVLALYGSLLVGAEVVVMPAFNARKALESIARYEIDIVMGVPTMYARMIDAATSDDSLGGLRLALCGSAPLGRDGWQRFYDRFGVQLVERYGLTEVGIITTNPVDAPRGGSVGKPIPSTAVVVRTNDGYVSYKPGVQGPRGEICISGPTVMSGYGDDAQATAEAIHDGYFHSGDLGSFDADGYLWIDGRIKELIIVGGSNVIPGEVERALSAVGGVGELAVAGIPDADLGEVVAAFVVSRGAVSEADQHGSGGDDSRPAASARSRIEQDLRDAAERALARYKRPRRYLFVDELPRNAMGKIDRKRLTALSAEL